MSRPSSNDDDFLDFMIFQSIMGQRHHAQGCAGCAAVIAGLMLLTVLFTMLAVFK